MANHKGSEGVVKVGSNTVAEVRDWSLTQSADTIEDTAMGDSARTYKPSLTSASGSISVYWDESDTTGQGAMTAGSEVTLNLYPEGADSGDTYYTCSAIITEESASASFDGMVEASFSFSVNGAVTLTTVA
jgi:predicted secreted protein